VKAVAAGAAPASAAPAQRAAPGGHNRTAAPGKRPTTEKTARLRYPVVGRSGTRRAESAVAGVLRRRPLHARHPRLGDGVGRVRRVLFKIRAPEARDRQTRSNLVNITVIDSGCDKNHPDLARQLPTIEFAYAESSLTQVYPFNVSAERSHHEHPTKWCLGNAKE
jgi:subtilisin family serine protease